VIVDALGNLIRFVLLPGQRHDITSFDALMAGIYCLALIGDRALMPVGFASRSIAAAAPSGHRRRRGRAPDQGTTRLVRCRCS
jgi:hypothetical protein